MDSSSAGEALQSCWTLEKRCSRTRALTLPTPGICWTRVRTRGSHSQLELLLLKGLSLPSPWTWSQSQRKRQLLFVSPVCYAGLESRHPKTFSSYFIMSLHSVKPTSERSYRNKLSCSNTQLTLKWLITLDNMYKNCCNSPKVHVLFSVKPLN